MEKSNRQNGGEMINLPWKIETDAETGDRIITDADGLIICRRASAEDAARIVLAVNEHERLRNMLTKCLPIVDQSSGADRLGIAIADELRAIAKAEAK